MLVTKAFANLLAQQYLRFLQPTDWSLPLPGSQMTKAEEMSPTPREESNVGLQEL